MANLLKPNVTPDLNIYRYFLFVLIGQNIGFFLRGHLRSLKREELYINSLNNFSKKSTMSGKVGIEGDGALQNKGYSLPLCLCVLL